VNSDFVRSDVKPPGRRLWVLDSNAESPARLFVFLDGELYLEWVCAGDVVRQLQNDARTPPLAAVFVSNNGAAARHSDYVCDADYTWFLAQELLPFLIARHPNLSSASVVLIGLSLSALAAAHAAISTSCFRAAICQSPSFWWQQERFVSSLPEAGAGAAPFWVSVGDRETESGVSHPPSGLFQGTSQRDSCDRAVAAFRKAGYLVTSRLFPGGHDAACWRDDLALALRWASSP
jgi:enterochelin esterase family protein